MMREIVVRGFFTDWMPRELPENWMEAWKIYLECLYEDGFITKGQMNKWKPYRTKRA